MRKLSFGNLDSTAGNWAEMCSVVFGPDSKSARYFKALIEVSPAGKNEEILTEETQVMQLVLHMEGAE